MNRVEWDYYRDQPAAKTLADLDPAKAVEHYSQIFTAEWLAMASNSMAAGDPVYDWQSLAVQYANALAAANARIIELERQLKVAALPMAECRGESVSRPFNALANAMRADRLPDAYAR